MNYTTNFNLNKPEGTDLYNHLTVDNPNMDIIDGAMQANKLASVGAATELVSGTVHAITRSDSNQNIFKFKATGDFKAGDTITVDGVSVNAYTTGGQPLINDAYVLSAEVLCILDGVSLWILTNAIPVASEISYDNNNNIYQEIFNLKAKYTGSIAKYSGISGGTLDKMQLIKKGYTVTASARLYNISETAQGYFFEIPDGFRPSALSYVMAYLQIDGEFIPVIGEIRNDGLVYVSYSTSKTATQVAIAGTWVVG